TGYEAPPFLARDEESESLGWLGKIRGIESERHDHRRAVGYAAEQLAQPRVETRQQRGAAVRLAGYHEMVAFQPAAGQPDAKPRANAFHDLRAGMADIGSALEGADDGCRHLAETPFQCAEQRSAASVARRPASRLRALGQQPARQTAVPAP